jgi:integrase
MKRRDNLWQKRKGGNWYFQIRRRGQRLTFKGWTDRESTRRLMDDLKVQIARYAAGLPPAPTLRCDLMTEHLTRLGLIAPRINKTLPQLVDDYLRQLAFDGDCDEHIARVKSRLLRVITGCNFQRLTDIDTQAIIRFLERMTYERNQQTGKSSLATRRAYVLVLRSFGKWMDEQEVCDGNPFRRLRPPRIKDHQRVVVRRALSLEARGQLLAATATRRSFTQLGNRDRVGLYVAAMATGLRAEELATLTPANFDFNNAVVRQPKTKNGKRAVLPIHPVLIAPLRCYVESKAAGRPIWPGCWFRKAAEMLRSDLKAAAIPYKTEMGQVDFHSLRHTFTTSLAEAGIEASTRQRLTRHASLDQVDNYTHLPSTLVVEAMAKVAMPQVPAILGGG